MKVQAEISLYPLQERDPLTPIEQFLNVLEAERLEPRMNPMSTTVIARSEDFFRAISRAFHVVASEHRCVLVLKCSNVCPGPKLSDRTPEAGSSVAPTQS